MPIDTETFNSSYVSRLAKISLRQLQWWDERNVVQPRHEGHRRIYTRYDVREILVIANLRRKGLSLQKIRRVLRYIQRNSHNIAGTAYVLTDGRSVYIERNMDGVAKCLLNHRAPLAAVTLPLDIPAESTAI